MSSIKCKNCGLTNFAYADACARCGNSFSLKRKKERKPRRFGFLSLAAFAGVGAILYYSYGGVQKSIDDVSATDANRVAAQPKTSPQPAGLSRTQYDRQRAAQVGTSIQNSNSLAQTQSHDQDLQKAMNVSTASPDR